MKGGKTSELYSRISRRMWGDAAFRALSAPQPNARDLWIYLLTGQHVTPIPGLFSTTKGDLAERLGWPAEDFLKCLGELSPKRSGDGSDEGSENARSKVWFVADWSAQVVWIRGAISHNEPANFNIVRSWKSHWKLIPECDVKDQAFLDLRCYMERRGKGFAKAFLECCGQGYAERLADGYPQPPDTGTRARTRLIPSLTRRVPPPIDLLDSTSSVHIAEFRECARARSSERGVTLPRGSGDQERRLAAHVRELVRDHGVSFQEAAEKLTDGVLDVCLAQGGTLERFVLVALGFDPWAPRSAAEPKSRAPKRIEAPSVADHAGDVEPVEEQLRRAGLVKP